MKAMRIVVVLAVLVLLVLHNDGWNRERTAQAIWGWVPVDLAYHVVWVVASSAVLWLVMRAAWGRKP